MFRILWLDKWIPKTHLPLFISDYEEFFTFTTVLDFWCSTGKKNFLLSPLKIIERGSGVARGSAARGGSRNCLPQMSNSFLSNNQFQMRPSSWQYMRQLTACWLANYSNNCGAIGVSGAPEYCKRGVTTGGLGAWPPTANKFLQFSHKKNTYFSTLFNRKRVCSECSLYRQCKSIFAAYV